MQPRAGALPWESRPKRPAIVAADPAEPKQPEAAPRLSFHDMTSRLTAIERAPVFFALREGILRSIARRVRRIKIAPGEMIVCQGEQGDSLFFIERGRCRMVVEKPPSIVTVAVLGEGDYFGDGACLLGRPHQASVYAQGDCYLLALDRQSLNLIASGYEEDIIEELRRVAEQRFNVYADVSVQATWGQLLGEATVIGVYSPKGGSGGTCVSLNLTGALSRRYPGEVLLLDLDFPYSHSALLAGLVPTSCLARMASVPADGFDDVLLSAILYDRGGPMILPGALRPEEADDVTPELVTRAIEVLRKTFRFIVVDLGVTISDSTLALFDLTQHVVLVTAPDLSAVKSAADAVDILRELGAPDDRMTVVLNHRSEKPAVDRAAVKRTLKRDIDVEIEFDGTRPEQAAVDGVILSLTNPKSEMARGTETLAALLDSMHTQRVARTAATAPAGTESAQVIAQPAVAPA
jgi:Flp pilus assembly CpaE family ATPase